jgi:hypothetical protein
MKMKTAPAFAALLLASACATYDDFRTMEPIARQKVAGDYRPLADCVADRLRSTDEEWHLVTSAQPVTRTARITGTTMGLFGPSQTYLWDLALVQEQPGVVRAETRSLSALGSNNHAPRDLDDVVRTCASQLAHQAVSPTQR